MKLSGSIQSFLDSSKNLNILLLLILITFGISLQQYFLPDREFWDAIRPQYNNYLIFKYSFSHLVNKVNLYSLHLNEHGDLFKYSPTFALFMGLFYYLPDWLGLMLWNLLNALCLYAGIRSLPELRNKTKVFILLYILLELIGNLQNEQSNALMTGFILLTFVSFEKRQFAAAALFVMLGFYLKLFGLVAATLIFLYPQKLRSLIWLMIWAVVLWILPLMLLSFNELIEQYANWFEVVLSDHRSRYGFSILGIMHKWFGLDLPKLWVLAIGIILLSLGYLRREMYPNYEYRLLFLSSILIWVILFNHTAESSGYILAMTGVAIWYFTQERKQLRTVLVVLAFIVVSLFSTDLMPASVRNNYIYPYYVRTIPVLLIWIVLMVQMVKKPQNHKKVHQNI